MMTRARLMWVLSLPMLFAACGPASNMNPDSGSGLDAGMDAGVNALDAFMFGPSNVRAQGPNGLKTLAQGQDVELNSPCMWNGETGYFCGLDVPYVVLDQNDANNPKVAVFSVGKLTIGQNASVLLQGAYPIVVLATGDITVVGSIMGRASETDSGGVAGGGRGIANQHGPGTGGGGAADPATREGGGGGGYCDYGGKGGPNANGGRSYIISGAEPLVGGSAGGGSYGANGHGGAALELTSATKLTMAMGSIIYAGGGGGNAPGEGGGSGGVVLLESETVKLDGTIVVNGGSGGASCAQGIDVGNGQSAQLSGATAAGGQTPQHASGGDGSSSTVAMGQDGQTETMFCAGEPTVSGGGGGGSGYLYVKSRAGQSTGSPNLYLSAPCVHQEMLNGK